MKTKSPVWLLLFLALALPVRAIEVSSISSLGNDTYSVTAKATHKFTRNTEKLKAAAEAAAAEFCAKEGRQLKVVSSSQRKSMYLVGELPHVTLTFKALAANDPALAPASAPAATPAPAPAVAAPKSMTTDELQSELTKLDDMRKKGLLTDAEFDALKQKIISRF